MEDNASKEKFEELEKAIQPVIDFIYKYGDPYTTVIIQMDLARVVQDTMGMPLAVRD